MTALALRARNLLADHPLGGMHPAPLEFVFRLLGLEPGRKKTLNVYERLQLMERIYREHRDLEREEREVRQKGKAPRRESSGS